MANNLLKRLISWLIVATLAMQPVPVIAAVPTAVTDLNSTASSNSPSGSESIGTSLDDYLRAGYAFTHQLFDTGTIYCGTVGGTADVITLTCGQTLTAFKTGQAVAFFATGTNTTNVTVNPDSLGAKALTKNGTTALVAGDIPSGALVVGRYDGTRFQLESATTAFTMPPFTDTTGISKGSSDATKILRFEVDGFTTATTRVLTAPNYDGTIATQAGTETLTNKTLTDSTNTVADDGDATKKLAFQLSGVTTGNTRTVTVPDKSGTMAMTSDIGWTNIYDQTVTTQSSIPITTDMSSYKIIKVTMNITTSTTLGVYIKTSNDGGSTYYEASSDYIWMHTGSSASSSAGDTSIHIGDNTLSTARTIVIYITNLGDANSPTMMTHTVLHSNPLIYIGMGQRAAATSENAFKIITSTGTISGRIRVDAI